MPFAIASSDKFAGITSAKLPGVKSSFFAFTNIEFLSNVPSNVPLTELTVLLIILST